MIDHLSLAVRDFARSKAFYSKALAPLGYKVLMEFGDACGFGDEKPAFWMRQGDPPTSPLHLAFAAKRQADVRGFYDAAMKAGGRDNGAPGLRKEYHPTYYGAFVYDPDGHPIEAVCHREEVKKAPARAAAKRAAPARSGAKPKPVRKAAAAKRRSRG
jgi:catechol 2,3-dioxygenase-like lactoylglutathione lyase family enzyme